MRRVTVITQHLSASDLNYTVLKELMRVRDLGFEVCWLYENDCTPFVDIRIPKMSVGKLWEDQTNEGSIIATSIESSILIKDLPNKKEKVFYIWNPEFLYSKRNYEENLKAFDIKLYTRSESYKNLIKNYSNKTPEVIDFNLEKICL